MSAMPPLTQTQILAVRCPREIVMSALLLLADVLPRKNPSSGSSDWLLVVIPVVVVAIGVGLLLLLRSRRRARRAVEDQDKS
ncbi:MAG: hypothetical protein ACJ76X_09095 [Solirubrobacteraceae bacterium]